MTLEQCVNAWVSEARAARQRRVVVFAGSQPFGIASAQQALAAAGLSDALWITKTPPPHGRALPASHAHHLLGSEVDAVVFDLHAGLDVEAFGAVAGTVRAGGLFILIAPPRGRWSHFADPEQARITVHPVAPEAVTRRFMIRFEREVNRARGVMWVEEGQPIPSPVTPPPSPAPALEADEWGCLTSDQRTAVAAILDAAHAQMPAPLVLTSDRGRGKSAALGLAAAQLLREGMQRIVVTAPRFDAAATIFAHAQHHLPAAQRSRDVVSYRDARLQFVAPDALAAIEPPQLLLVDEAAAIPAHALEKMVAADRRVVFATTVHGYEGSGRGFATRFQSLLDTRTPGWRALELRQPVRWADDDPLEALVFRALLLDGSVAEDERVREATVARCRIERIERDALLDDEPLLNQLFGLLVLAHYRTTPLDLRFLLDGPNLSLWLVRYEAQVVGAALVAEEGAFDAALARAVWEGRRRPRGHLLAQSLAVHAGIEEAPTRRLHRIVRIAIHPAVQRRGLGHALLQSITDAARASGADGVGSSFAASPALIAFWQRADLWPVRLGVTREATSGAPAVMVLRPLTPVGTALQRELRGRFLDLLPHLLVDPLRDLDPAIGAALAVRTSCDPSPLGELDERDWRELAAYAAGCREVELVLGPVMRLVAETPLQSAASDERPLLEMKLRERKPWPEIVSALGMRGRGEATQALRRALRSLIVARGGAGVVSMIAAIEHDHQSDPQSRK